MKLQEYRNSSSWLGAIELGPKLMELAEELPASEEMGLSFQLRQLMVDLPATVCADLVDGTDSRRVAAYRLLATLELVDRVYPALDTAGVRNEADALVESLLSGDSFSDMVGGPKPAAAVSDDPEPEEAPATPAPSEVVVQPDGPEATR